MVRFSVCLTLFAFFASGHAVGFRGFTYEGRKEPELDVSRASSVIESWIEQPVDHFNVRDNRTWLMRYYENNEFINGSSGPIFIMLGGEWEISPGFIQLGLMYEIAKEHGAMMYYTEHRYYGDSRPVNDTKSANLQYLNVDQALADVANFIDTKKQENENLANSSVIVFGGSYAGNMAAWARIKYPHLIQGALASSAPVRAKADFPEYYDVVTTSLARYSENCTEDIHDAFSSVEALLDATDGPEQLKKIFNLCQEPDLSSPSTVAYLMTSLEEMFAANVQYNRVGENGTSSISLICDLMMNETLGSPMMRLVELVSGDKCIYVDYNKMITTMTDDSWEKTGAIKLWLYQTCTEFGYYQTTSSNSSIFGNRVSFEFYVQLCSDIYGDYYDLSLLDSEVRRTNIMYGGSLPDVDNVVFTNGNVDPWHALSVLEDLNENSPAILINGSSHCEEFVSGH